MTSDKPGGPIEIAIGDHNGMVVLQFPSEVTWVTLDPAAAVQIGEALCRSSYRAKFGDWPTTTDKSAITEQLRIRCRNRVTMLLRQLVTSQKALDLQASQIVDAILKEVL